MEEIYNTIILIIGMILVGAIGMFGGFVLGRYYQIEEARQKVILLHNFTIDSCIKIINEEPVPIDFKDINDSNIKIIMNMRERVIDILEKMKMNIDEDKNNE